MSDATATTATTTTDAATATTDATTTDTGDGTKDWQAEAEKWKDLSRKHEERAKANAVAAKELEQVRQQHMSEQEKVVAQAKAEGRAEALAETGATLVAAEVRAVAAGRMSDEQLATLLEGLNLPAFLTADGEVDTAKVAKYVDGIAPKPDENGPSRFPDLGQGARGGGGGTNPNTPLNGDPLLRDVKAKLGIR